MRVRLFWRVFRCAAAGLLAMPLLQSAGCVDIAGRVAINSIFAGVTPYLNYQFEQMLAGL